MRPIIRVENLSKRYVIGASQAQYKTLRESITETLRSPFDRFRRNGHHVENTVWALKDVSLDIYPGEVVGVIGRNGAGKSTLLKILSRITEPTSGKIDLYGRIGSLLEVGTGFHPELTGRENIYLNGAILGMKRGDIDRHFDEIVMFAEIEQFIETPVKRYSSGMYMRLAFAVAAHLEPEILVVDEVLAVGDAAFQKKCLGKMGDIARQGRTVIFVSHNSAAVSSLCTRCALLEKGGLVLDGSVDDVLSKYVMRQQQYSSALEGGVGRYIKQIELRDERGRETDSFLPGEPVNIVLWLDLNGAEMRKPAVGIGVNTLLGQRVFTAGTFLSKDNLPAIRGRASVVGKVFFPPLAPGSYLLKVALGNSQGDNIEEIENAVRLNILASDFYGNGKLPNSSQGVVMAHSNWKLLD